MFSFSFWLKNLQTVNQLIPPSGSTDWLLSSGEFTCWFTCSQILTKLYLNSEAADSEHIHTLCLFLLQAHKPHRREWTDSPLSESHPGGKTPERTWTSSHLRFTWKSDLNMYTCLPVSCDLSSRSYKMCHYYILPVSCDWSCDSPVDLICILYTVFYYLYDFTCRSASKYFMSYLCHVT